MTLETLTNCSCLRKLEKDMISESLQVNLHIVKDLLNQTAKFKPDTALVKRFKSQQIFTKNSKVLSEDLKVKVDNTPVCKS
jgi:hypothetical protein